MFIEALFWKRIFYRDIKPLALLFTRDANKGRLWTQRWTIIQHLIVFVSIADIDYDFVGLDDTSMFTPLQVNHQ
jgi:hypothetical protein